MNHDEVGGRRVRLDWRPAQGLNSWLDASIAQEQPWDSSQSEMNVEQSKLSVNLHREDPSATITLLSLPPLTSSKFRAVPTSGNQPKPSLVISSPTESGVRNSFPLSHWTASGYCIYAIHYTAQHTTGRIQYTHFYDLPTQMVISIDDAIHRVTHHPRRPQSCLSTSTTQKIGDDLSEFALKIKGCLICHRSRELFIILLPAIELDPRPSNYR
ncbi:hypothetical protein O181_026499 [Austropuccinia psidii MF-1]|uniref:Uncharacterized protein n=1 Tax=Austropuccinia psidii MF-1 TaxID=1389203 RepID=A0A9Q3CMF2_9BASI|nr:hypothetical protein [Austropuccinia psidii MF-1]